jgi:antirestriction protein
MTSIYIASLSDYNSGRLVGEWVEIDANTTADDLYEAAAAVLAAGEPGAEEFAVHDTDGFPAGLLGEYDSLERYAAYGAFLAGDNADERFAFVDNDGSYDVDSLESAFIDSYIGTYNDIEDYATERLDALGAFDALLALDLDGYLDVSSYARDLELTGSVSALRLPDYSVALFSQ